MSTISVPRSLVSNTNPTEAQLDTMRTYLLNFFNGASLNEDNIATGGMLWSSLAGSLPDDEPMKWTNSHATIQYVSATDKFELKNTEGSVLWAHRDGANLVEFMELRSSDGALEIWGVPWFNAGTGHQTVNLLWFLSRYRKPRLVYQDDDIVTLETNSSFSESIILMRDRLGKFVDTTCSLAATANGVGADTGAAVSGLASGLTRTANRWYYIYAVRVQSGDDNDGANCIMIAHTTSPEAANTSALDTAFGAGEWVYLGIVRNGYNDGVSTNVIVPFVYDESGYMRFTQTPSDNEPGGLTLATATGTTVNLSYDIVIGNSAAATIPPVATRVMFGGHRESHGFELHYREIASGENHMITTGCWHVSELADLKPCVYIEVPLLAGYRLEIVMGNVATDKRISLLGLVDHYQ